MNLRDSEVSLEDLTKMQKYLRRRGPDADGILRTKNIGLAHTRLSIVDLSDSGNQPMSVTDQDTHLVFNGEIFNFKALRNELEKSGRRFVTKTDTEVLLQGYLEWGAKRLAQKIDGQFAFVIVDLRSRKAFAIRDRFGQKPLYYSNTGQQFLFSSDIRSIASHLDSLTIDAESLDYYFSELGSPQPRTIWEQIKQVEPAHCLELDLQSGDQKSEKFWAIEFTKQVDVSFEDALDIAESEIEEAVIRRIHGDVPMGAFLSSGVDSGLVTAFLAKNSSDPIKTFTISVDYEEYDESEHARELSERYATEHHQIHARAGNLLSVVENLIEYCGEPFADSSLIPSHLICEAIAGEVKVALSGDGGDEMFGGYFNYADAFAADRYLEQNEGRGAAAREFALNVNKVASRFGLSKENKGNAAAYAKMHGADRLYRMMGLSESDKKSLYTTEFLEKSGGWSKRHLQSKWDSARGNTITDQLREASLGTRLLNDYLVKVDRASMFNSIEVRSPFLDHHLAQSIANVSSAVLLQGGVTKLLTKRLAEKYIAPDVMKRPKKGFGIPVAEWLRSELKEPVRGLLGDSIAVREGILESKPVLKMFDEHVRGEVDSTNKIWSLFCFEIWLRKCR